MENIDLNVLADQARLIMRTDNKAAAGAIFVKVKRYFESNPEAGLWTRWMQTHHFRWEVVKTCVRAYEPPGEKSALATYSIPRKKAPIPLGEMHEATRGFKAMMDKAAREEDITQSRRRRTVAFQHFKFLLSKSDLPGLMNMTPDQIIELVRKI